ncbi:MAG: ribonuclease HII [Calditrichae bacterium]|nr:ribonuclease HII [Calditrichia bacterium]
MNNQYDNQLWRDGIKFLAGIDEVGRGPLAGPVVAAAVILDPGKKIYKVDDSKKLTEKQRQQLAPRIKEKAHAWAIAEASVEEIDRLNIINATFLAMKRALDQLEVIPEFILVDGRDFPTFLYRDQGMPLKGRAVIKGDGISASIASASIIAKVYRDEWMTRAAEKFPGYGFEKHKGYAASEHMAKIRELGPCSLHRKKFIRNIMHEKAQQLSWI